MTNLLSATPDAPRGYLVPADGSVNRLQVHSRPARFTGWQPVSTNVLFGT
jgi:hypothetical protein